MSNNVFRNSFIQKCRYALAASGVATDIDHNGLRGTYREILTRQLLQPVLPPNVRLGTGKLVSADGQNSRQIDVTIYAPEIMPPFLFDDTSGLFPIESSLYTVEVKTRLTARDLEDAIESAKVTRLLRVTVSEHWTGTQNGPVGVAFLPALPVKTLFAFGTDLTSDPSSEFERYCRLDSSWRADPALQAFVVVGRGYWYHRHQGWAFVEATADHDEVMAFLAGTTNTIPQLMAAKGRPRFGNYLWQGQAQKAHAPDGPEGNPLAEDEPSEQDGSIAMDNSRPV